MPDAPLPRPPRSCSPPPPAIFVSCSYGSRTHCASGSEGQIGQPATIEMQAKNIGNEQGENDRQTRKGCPSDRVAHAAEAPLRPAIAFPNETRLRGGSTFRLIAQSWSMASCNSSYSLIFIPS